MSNKDKLQAINLAYMEDSRFDALRRDGTKFVPGAGALRPSLMLIGEAPGRTENAKGQPFVGRSGDVLRYTLTTLGVNMDDVYMTNAVKYWPQDAEGVTRAPTAEELAASRYYLIEEIKAVEPKVVGLCGLSAIKAIYPEVDSVYSYNGELLDNLFVPLYHPAVIIYTPRKSPVVSAGYRKLKEHMDAR